jgi:hypothetical protein
MIQFCGVGQDGHIHLSMYSSADRGFRISDIVTLNITPKFTSGAVGTLTAIATGGVHYVDSSIRFDKNRLWDNQL